MGEQLLEKKKKHAALDRLSTAEKQLVDDMKAKLEDAKNAEEAAANAESDAAANEHSAVTDAENAKTALSEANGDLAHITQSEHQVQTKLKNLNGEIVVDKKV